MTKDDRDHPSVNAIISERIYKIIFLISPGDSRDNSIESILGLLRSQLSSVAQRLKLGLKIQHDCALEATIDNIKKEICSSIQNVVYCQCLKYREFFLRLKVEEDSMFCRICQPSALLIMWLHLFLQSYSKLTCLHIDLYCKGERAVCFASS